MKAKLTLDNIPEYTFIEDWQWESVFDVWYLKFSITIEETKDIDKTTYWVATVKADYPYGDIEIYPDAEKGITDTYPHQSNNGIMPKNDIWKSGKLCLDYQKFGSEQLPLNDIYRLQWYVFRAVRWVRKANESVLLEVGDWFELPMFAKRERINFAYQEDEGSYYIWGDSLEIHGEHYGFTKIETINSINCVVEYNTISGKIIYAPVWGEYVNQSVRKNKNAIGAWIYLNDIPVINKWQAPNTFGELKQVFSEQGLQLKDVLTKLFSKFRDSKKHFLLIGFPIPKKLGGEPSVICWKTLLLPVLSSKNNCAKGFRPNEKGWLRRDFSALLSDEMKLHWCQTDNCSEQYVYSRGKYEKSITQKKYLVIGAGSLSSFLCEQFVRNGVNNLRIMDSDTLEAGNLSRHSLSVDDIGTNKAHSLARHLNSISIHANIKSIEYNFYDGCVERLKEEYSPDVIIDCTAEEGVLKTLENSCFKSSALLFSLSVGFDANPLYLAASKLSLFIYNDFVKTFKPTISRHLNSIEPNDIPWEGTGCWSPVFPATTSDMLLASATAANIIAAYLKKDETLPKYFIYEKDYNKEGYLIGYNEVNYDVQG